MNERIDVVAKALCDFDIGNDAWNFTGEHDCRDDYRALARVAIKAMRIPLNCGFVQDITDAVFNEKIDEALK